MFEQPIELFNKFVKVHEKLNPSLMPVNMEIQNKLYQLNWLINKAKGLQRISLDSFAIHDAPNFQAIRELEIVTESFYHFAFRLRDVLQCQHPCFKGFESKGIRDVRNHLLVHPEKQGEDAKIIPSFGYSDDLNIGPKIKSYIGGNHLNQDKGLFINAGELCESLVKIIKRELRGINAKKTN